MDEQLWEDLNKTLDELQEFCVKTMAEIGVMRIQVSLLKNALNQ